MEEQPPQITNQSTTTTTAPPPPPLNQPSLLTRIPEIPISNLISRHLSTKLTINSTDSIQDLINQKSWKTLADVIANQIINTPSIEAESLLKLWSIRFECLMRLNQPRILSNEITKFFKTIHKSYRLSSSNMYELIPFSILVIKARLPYLLNPNETSMNQTINLVHELMVYCKSNVLKNLDDLDEWKNKLVWLNDLLISILNGDETHQNIKIDYDLINELMNESDLVSKVQFRIENGDLIGLEPQLKPDEIHLHSLLDVAKGEWTSSESKCKDVLKTSEDFSTNLVLNNQLALSLLYQGKISEALEIMKSLVSSVKDTSLMDSLIFNLVTILELRSTTAQLEKIDLLNQIKNQVSIESLNPNVFKLD